MSYAYDAFGNLTSRKYNGTTAFTWVSDRGGNVVREKDLINNVQYDYTYDSTGRLVRKTAKDSTKAYNANSLWYNLEYGYDLNNNITRLVYRMPQRSVLNKYAYGEDNLLKKYDINDSRSVSYNYDDVNRLNDISISTDNPINMHYYYMDSKRSGYSTTKIYEEEIDDVTYRYEYDIAGNITKISEVISDNYVKTLYTYKYDKLNELTEIMDYNNYIKYSYIYNTGGNITKEDITYYDSSSIPVKTKRIAYIYGDSNWKDKLTKYNGQEITYDAIGNPLTYRDGMTMTWKNGRQLDTFTNGTNNVSYSYDSNSVRISKTVNGVKYTYAYVNGLLMYETRGEAKFYYSYDANGTLYSVKYTLTDSSDLLTYYYTHNSRGDIVGIYNGAGQLRAHYEYDAWGSVLSVTDQNGNAITSSTHIGNLNPFRYRGYYYDTESGFYYLMSRYYDPVTHRFINCDGYFQSGGDILDANMSAYCRNNPIMYSDSSGTMTSEEILMDIVNNPDSKYSVKDATVAQKNETQKYKYTKSSKNKKHKPYCESVNYKYIQTEEEVQKYYRELSYGDYEYQASVIEDFSSFIDFGIFEKIAGFFKLINKDGSAIVDDLGNLLYIEKGYSLVYYDRVYMWDGSTMTETQYILFDCQDVCVFNKCIATSYICD